MNPAHIGAAKLVPPYSLARQCFLVGAGVEGEVCVGRDVRAIAIRCRALVAGIDHARELLPRGIAILSGEMPPPLSTHAVSDAHGPSCLGRGQISTADRDDMLASSAGHASFSRRPRRTVARGGKERLPLRRHLLEIRVERRWDRPASSPHEQPIVVGSGLCVVMALMMAVSVEPIYTTRLASPGAMPERLGHVQVLFGVVAAAALLVVQAGGARPVVGEKRDWAQLFSLA